MGWIRRLGENYRGLPREIYILFISTIINRFGSFVHAFLTLFLTQKLGMSLEKTGVYIAASGAASLIGIMIGGHLGDYIGRKRAYLVAESLSALLFIPCGFLINHPMIPILLIASSFFGSIVYPISDTMIADLVTSDNRKRAYSLLYFGINIGVAVGPILAAYLFQNHLSYLFWGDAFTTFIAVLLILRFIPETKKTRVELEDINDTLNEREKMEECNALKAFLKRPILVFFTLFNILTSFVYAQGGFALPIDLVNMFGEEAGTLYFGKLMSLNAIVVIAFTLIISKLTDAIRPIFSIAFANILYGIGFGMMLFVTDIPLVAFSVFVWTLGEIVSSTNTGVFITGHTPITHRSRFNAIISFIRSVGNLLGPALGGFIIHYFNIGTLWKTTIVFSILAFGGMVMVGLMERKKYIY